MTRPVVSHQPAVAGPQAAPAASPVAARHGAMDAANLLALQRTAGNAAVGSLVIQRDDAGAAPAFNDDEFKRMAMGSANDYLLSGQDFPPAVPGRVTYWKTMSAWREVDEDHFYTDANGAEQHVKVKITLSGGDLAPGAPNPDKYLLRVIRWNDAGQEITVRRSVGWIDATGTPHRGEKPQPPQPPDQTPEHPHYHDNDDNVPV
ncbi:hypothetical protein JOF56_007555 [Kibdelosporangium banguiense]|uniref:Uncharacterized protein n=1 Tax=Kibdelosporangium banguiense TaxID=1365924 RepID=A0ABS4TT64_9PSEU|nr:hypothetical protein [Kibdelosporangium banguiense]MBP2327170.1 hypothetical protein [Kibdelosporangium banguiense]